MIAFPRDGTYAHGSMQRASDVVVLLQSRAATENLWLPERRYGTFHVANLSLGGSGRLDPLGGLSAHTAYHVSMRESLWSSLAWLDVQSRRKRLGDSRV